jgi:NADPH-dependent glutamate synthase beta subunit-like oxidoreductase
MTLPKPFAITLDPGSSLANKTGSWRSERPVYVNRLPPCNAQCPAGEDIQGWLFHAESGNYEQAWRHLTRDNPFPAIMGRVCYHSCEGACNRGQLDTAVGINSVERFLGDEALKRGWRFEPPAAETGKRVLVVGAGPSGMSAAYHLRRRGHAVTVIEAGAAAGGMMRFGIPKYRLPRDVLDAEMQRIVDLGVTLKLGTKVADLAATMKEGGFDAAFLAVGAHLAKRAYIPAQDAVRMLDAVSVLRSMEGEEPPLLGRRVVVYGGGNTAIDVARTAKRLGATEAIIVYRRTREKMPAHDFELEEALQEGVMVKWLSTIRQAGSEGHPTALTIEKMRLNEQGQAEPTGETETLEADSLVLALGQDVDLSLLEGVPGLTLKDGVVQVDPATLMTGHPGFFAGGDMVPAERNVTVAVGHGKRRPSTSTPGCAARCWPLRPNPPSPASTGLTPGTTATPPRPCAPNSISPAAPAASTRCREA